MKAIKNILVPVDFSENSKAAFEYAVAMAEDMGAESVKALYIYDDYMPASPLADPLIIPSGKSEEDLQADLENFIAREEEVLSEVTVKHRAQHKTQAAYGLPVETIVMFSETGDYDLIVMGTTGSKDLSEVWFGSTATNVSQKADCPVLLVPAGATYKGAKDMIYACDFDHKSIKHINVVADIATTLKTDVELLFVKTFENESSHYSVDVTEMRDVFKAAAPEVNFTAHIVEEDSVVEGVNSFAKKANADFVTVVTKHRSFWQRFIHSSMTKQMAMYAELPVLVIHVDE
jgi:nucleotide-binding universal stress UspA family protein